MPRLAQVPHQNQPYLGRPRRAVALSVPAVARLLVSCYNTGSPIGIDADRITARQPIFVWRTLPFLCAKHTILTSSCCCCCCCHYYLLLPLPLLSTAAAAATTIYCRQETDILLLLSTFGGGPGPRSKPGTLHHLHRPSAARRGVRCPAVDPGDCVLACLAVYEAYLPYHLPRISGQPTLGAAHSRLIPPSTQTPPISRPGPGPRPEKS